MTGLVPLVAITSEDLEASLPTELISGMDIVRWGDLLGEKASIAQHNENGSLRRRAGLKRIMKRSPLPILEVMRAAVTLIRLVRLRRFATELFARYRPVGMIVCDDRSVGAESVFLREARTRGCVSLIVPFAASDPWSDAYLRHTRTSLLLDSGRFRLVKRLLARRLPGQRRDTQYGPMLFFPVPTTIMLWLLRLLPPNPWSIGGGLSDAIAVFGPTDRARLVEAGIDSAKIAVTGQPLVDELYASSERGTETRRRLDEVYGFDSMKPLLCCALPHLGEHDLIPWETHWGDTQHLLDVFMDSGCEVLLSLHPKSDPRLYEEVIDSRGLAIASQPLRRILSAADVFVATYSSTVRWAALLAIPTLIFDLHGMNYPMYDHIQGLVRCDSIEDLPEALRKIAFDDRFRTVCREALKDSGRTLEPLDGQAVARVLNALAERLSASSGVD